MPGAFPAGLVIVTESISDEIESFDRVLPEDVARLWRVYSANSAIFHDNIGDRLQNFFWRIWSNPHINRTITGETVARIFTTLSEGGDRVRTTPVPSPRATSPAPDGEVTPTSSPPKVDQQVPIPPASKDNEKASLSAALSQSRASPRSPTPILKKPRSESDTPTTFTQLLTQDNHAEPSSRKASLSFASDPPSPKSPVAMERSSSNGAKKRASFVVAGGARTKTKPTLGRRKSSQSNNLNIAEAKKSPRPPSKKSPPHSPEGQPGINAQPLRKGPPPGLPPRPTAMAAFELPSASSWQDIDSPASSNALSSSPATSHQPTSFLVDSNFRGKFVDLQKRVASQTNLTAAGQLGKSKSTVRFLDKSSEGSKAAGQNQDGEKSEKAKGKELMRKLSGSTADTEAVMDDEAAALGLPRTKSQLSLMIAHERRKSGSHDIGPSPLGKQLLQQPEQRPPNTAQKKKDKMDDEEDEDDVVMMGRRDGVTKAGGVSKNIKNKQRLGPRGGEEFEYQSPPSPPLF